MKLLTLNFLTCAIKSCKPLPAAFPLHIRDAELELVSLDYNPLFLRNVLSRIEWGAMKTVLEEVGLRLPDGLPGVEKETAAEGATSVQGQETADMDVDGEDKAAAAPERKQEGGGEVSEEVLKRLHELLMETQISSGKLVCGNCGHEYAVREGIPNFLLPAHLV